jgi:dTMP kinase
MSYLITFEGGEGAGKTTLIDKVFAYLSKKGLSVLKTHEPGGTALGKAIRELLLHRKDFTLAARAELFLFLADRAQHVEEKILPALKAGSLVLCDRFNDSTIAYQAGARHLNETDVRRLCHFAAQGLEPHLTFYLDIDPLIGLKRLSSHADRIESEEIAFHQTIRATFQKIASQEPRRVHLIDASGSKDAVFNQVKEEIDVFLSRR